MPCIKIWTNVSKNKIAGDFVDKIIPTVAKALNKPEERCVCVLSSDVPVHMFGDSERPGAVATIDSIGSMAPDENITTARLVTDFIKQELGVDPKRVFISFHDMRAQDIAVDGSTVAGAAAASPAALGKH